MRAFIDYYRCPDDVDLLAAREPVSSQEGYFRFGNAVAYGRVANVEPVANVSDSLTDVFDAVTIEGTRARLPFDLSHVATNMRRERYRQNGDSWLLRSAARHTARRLYYSIRPLMGVGVRRHLQRAHFRGWQQIAFPRWPVDFTVDTLMESAMVLALKASGRARVPFVWFWPDGATACGMMTHDVEGQAGLDFCNELMDIDAAHGVPSAFQLIPEVHKDVWPQTTAHMRGRGFEVNLHDLNHDGRLFVDKQTFSERARRINGYARQFGCDGFRSGAMYREQDWYDAFEFHYDMSVPNAAHLEPQRGGCCTVMPYFVGDVLELPLTTTQDYTLFHILGDYSTTLWEQQIGMIVGRHGLVSVITHPDYMIGRRERQVYLDLLRHLVRLRNDHGMWMALPGEINRWWRNRQQMKLVPDGDGWRIEGRDCDRAHVAYASVEDGRLVYTLPGADSVPPRSKAGVAPGPVADARRPRPVWNRLIRDGIADH